MTPILGCLALGICGQSQTLTYVPRQVTVLVVPSVNASGDKYEAMKARQCKESDDTLHRLFSSRGFNVLSSENCAQMLNNRRGALTGVSNQTTDTLYQLGHEVGAQLVVFTKITHTWQKPVFVLVVPTQAGFATFETWLLDVPNHKAILAASTCESKSTAITESGSERQTRAVRLGLESQLNPFLQQYSEIKK